MKKEMNPYNKREDKAMDKGFKRSEKAVKPVAKDTNKTRRKNTLLPLPNKIKGEPFKKTSTNEKMSKKGMK